MEAAWLRSQLESGRSIESIAREIGRPASTVAYWANKHGLVSRHAARHAPRGPLDPERLRSLVEDGASVRDIARELERSPGTIRHWLKRYGLATRPGRYSLRDEPKPEALLRRCRLHGWGSFVPTGSAGHYRCARCNAGSVAARRRELKAILVAEAGGACCLCGYSRYAGALHFHHLDPTTKAFSLAERGLARSLEKGRAEAAKCVLVCANCHAEVEAGLATIAPVPPCRIPV
jgi:transposase-like protein